MGVQDVGKGSGTHMKITEEERQGAVKFIEELDKGETCPWCHTTIDKTEQVGRCMYARPCGHRLYQT
jgi:hypothetical protein